MSSRTRWLLPTGIEEVLPEQANILEFNRRRLLDLYASWGYQLVVPPFIEFLESLLIGDSEDLDLQTFKLTDQLSGRTLGVRADMTPQVARIDAHMLKSDAPSRLCYCGTVLLTRPEAAGGTRSPLQIGAELYGHNGIESDTEIIRLMMTTLQTCGNENVLLDIGHAGIFNALMDLSGCDHDTKNELFELIQRKSIPDIEVFLSQLDCNNELKTALFALISLQGEAAILSNARQQLKVGGKKVSACIDYMEELSSALIKSSASAKIHFDLADLRGYHYQNDIVFAAFDQNSGEELARGGRYDNIGEVFGRARPATGFSADLKKIIANNQATNNANMIFAPADDDPALLETITKLRATGEAVVVALTQSNKERETLGCTRTLQKENNKWVIKEV